jgi:hypothetical protein
MASIKTYPFQHSTILRINSEREIINVSPEYQRQGGVWNREKQQLLIDSIINDYDIPKIYFHSLTQEQLRESVQPYQYAIIDGRQRLEAIWKFIDGEFALSDDFEYLADPSVQAARLTYTDLAKEYPRIKIRFDSYILPIVLVETEDIDLIEDMFSRLNEAVPLNSAEKRNALGGLLARKIREVSTHDFFINRIKIGNRRYQHREIAARMLFLEDSISRHHKIIDTKKPFLDKMVVDYRDNEPVASSIADSVVLILDQMTSVFSRQDILLSSQAVITVYYLIFRNALKSNQISRITRQSLIQFQDALRENKRTAERDIASANYDFLEFDKMSLQGTNDAYSIRERTRIVSEFLNIESGIGYTEGK